MNRITKATRSVKKHKTALAATAGVVVGASAVYFTVIHGRTLLEVTASNVEHMRANGLALGYETDFGLLMLTVPKHA